MFNGSSIQTIPAGAFLSNTIKNLTLANNVSLAGQDSITGTLSFSGYNHTLYTNNYLTLKSTPLATANVAQVINGNNVIGDVIVERYISAKRAWRFLSVPTNTMQTYKQAWQEGATSSAVNPVCGYGIQITDKAIAWADKGFDNYSPDGPSLKKYNVATGAWVGISSTNSTASATGLINTHEGLMTFIRGDRTSVGLGATAYATVLRTKGALYTGTQPTMNVDAGKFASVGNPYASALDVRKISRSGVKDFFIVWDPYLANTNGSGLGAFQYLYKSGTNYYAQPGGGSYPSIDNAGNPSAPSNYIESGQAFFVQSTTGGTITLDENAKADVNCNALVFRSAITPLPALRTNLYAVEPGGSAAFLDGILTQFSADDEFDLEQSEAMKLINFNENLAIKKKNKLLAIARNQSLNAKDTVLLNMLQMKVRSYQLKITGSNFGQPDATAYLEDTYLNTLVPIDLHGNIVYNFDVTNMPASSKTDRFRIVCKTANSDANGIVKNIISRDITVFPNPIVNNTINLNLANQPLGVYYVELVNNAGQIVQMSQFKTTEGSIVKKLPISKRLAHGNYNVQISKPDNSKINIAVLY